MPSHLNLTAVILVGCSESLLAESIDPEGGAIISPANLDTDVTAETQTHGALSADNKNLAHHSASMTCVHVTEIFEFHLKSFRFGEIIVFSYCLKKASVWESMCL